MSQNIDQASRLTHATIRESEAAQYTSYSAAFLRKLRRQGRGPAFVRVGRSIRYRIVDLDAWLEAHRIRPREEKERV